MIAADVVVKFTILIGASADESEIALLDGEFDFVIFGIEISVRFESQERVRAQRLAKVEGLNTAADAVLDAGVLAEDALIACDGEPAQFRGDGELEFGDVCHGTPL